MKVILRNMICALAAVLLLVPPTAGAYQAATSAQQKEIQKEIDAGNKILKALGNAVSDYKKAVKANDRTKTQKLANELRAAYTNFKKSRQKAIKLADKYYKPDGKNAKGEPKYDALVKGEAVTHKDGSVRIGEAAFSSPGWLASSKMHEFVHTDQAKNGTWANDTKGSSMNELEAYDKEIEKAATSGLSKKQIKDLKRRRKSYYNGLSSRNKKKVDKKDYVARAITLQEAAAMGLCSVDLNGNGVAAGEIFTANIERLSKDPVVVELREGTPLVPTDRAYQTMITDRVMLWPLVAVTTTATLHGYCLNPHLRPPPKRLEHDEKLRWLMTNPDAHPFLAGQASAVIETAKHLSSEGKFHSDMPPEKYLKTVTQRALWYWADPEELNLPRLIEDLVQQVKESGGKQTKEQIVELATNIWADVNLTLKRSGVKPGTKPPEPPDLMPGLGALNVNPSIEDNSDIPDDLPDDPGPDDPLFLY